jgi:hypothetical protein
MIITMKPAMGLYVDKRRPDNWIVRDHDGRFWIVPPCEDAWERRQPFQPNGETELEVIPGHYLYLIGLPT